MSGHSEQVQRQACDLTEFITDLYINQLLPFIRCPCVRHRVLPRYIPDLHVGKGRPPTLQERELRVREW